MVLISGVFVSWIIFVYSVNKIKRLMTPAQLYYI
jgi:hypothetical protein